MKTHTIETRENAEEARAVATLVTAFAADPAMRWMYPGAQQYLRHFPDFIRAFGGSAFQHGTADSLGEFHSVALWLPPDASPDDSALAGVLQESMAPPLQAEVASLIEQMGQFHPPGRHWYLPLVGVDPGMQRRGLGSGLLMRGLERCDRERIPAYLEATNPRNLALYERLGFRTLGRIRTESSPVITPMLRQPR
jgi:ribosomal protein S18 acetylase RimI-like enzyme